MLTNLQIENVALIEKTEIHFEPGLNILSGETGAGKSMIIDSLHFAMGERVSRDFLRQGEKQATVSAMFLIEHEGVVNKLLERGIPVEEDRALLLSRSLNASGKTVCHINGRTVTIGMLREVTDGLIDIHGQHAHQSLLNPARHIVLLDRFCQSQLDGVMQEYQQCYSDFLQKDKQYQSLLDVNNQFENEKELLEFQADEISRANLSLEEEESLLKRRQTLLNSEKLRRLAEETMILLYDGTENVPAAADLVDKAAQNIQSVLQMDDSIASLCETITSVSVQLDDCARELRRYLNGIDTEESELLEVEERLQEIYRLKKKYGGSIPQVLSYYSEIQDKLDFWNNREQRLEEIRKLRSNAHKKATMLSAEISGIREKKAAAIGKEIENQLKELEMKNVQFQIVVTQKDELTANGMDCVEFLISPNQGEPLKPLAKIASGGEMSRVMLALKTILADADTVETFIFDEIDSGVSGRTAQKVAEKMSTMGKGHQIISITHLPQIAAMADAHFLIEKSAKAQKTVTTVTALHDETAVQELARLIGGTKITETTLLAAEDLKRQAQQSKRPS